MAPASFSSLYLLGAIAFAAGGLWLSAVAWGAQLPPFRSKADRLYLIVPGQLLTLTAAACGLLASGIPLGRAAGWLSAILTHGGP